MGNLQHLIDSTIRRNIQSIPFEGDTIDVNNTTNEINNLIEGLLKGFGTFVLQNFLITDKGWIHKNGKYYSREEAIVIFINQI